jgi:hypothetical protein
VATARRLRRLYDPEAAALAAVTVLLGRPAPEVVAAARVQVAVDACTVATAQGTILAVPEYARALVRGWAGRCVLPQEWACDVAATYLTLRLEAAEHHTGVVWSDGRATVTRRHGNDSDAPRSRSASARPPTLVKGEVSGLSVIATRSGVSGYFRWPQDLLA